VKAEDVLKRKGDEVLRLIQELSGVRTWIDRESDTEVSTAPLRQAIEHFNKGQGYIRQQLNELQQFRAQQSDDESFYF
jgi:thiamine biosynthesis protein ThiC